MEAEKRKTAAILLAGGSGSRFGADRNKVYVEALGQPLMAYSLAVFSAHPLVDEVILVAREGEKEMLESFPCGKPCHVVIGGSTRQESVLHGLMATDAAYVLIHDGARPLVQPFMIDRCLQAMRECHGATIAVRSKDTIKLADENDFVTMTTKRANTWIIQTPQCFDREVLLDAHMKFGSDPDLTDDCMLLERAGEPVRLLEGDYTNIKVTTPEDLTLAESFLAADRKRERDKGK